MSFLWKLNVFLFALSGIDGEARSIAYSYPYREKKPIVLSRMTCHKWQRLEAKDIYSTYEYWEYYGQSLRRTVDLLKCTGTTENDEGID